MSSPAKAAASRENAKLGGWPKGKKRGKRKRAAPAACRQIGGVEREVGAERPRRVQLSRRKGYKLPPHTVVVARPSEWGNPFPIAVWGRQDAIDMFAYLLAEGHDKRWSALRSRLLELRGKNLACWCPLNQPCHADVLLRVVGVVEETAA